MMKKILLAEDDTDFALVLKQYLALHDYDVTWAKDGEEALAMFQKESFNIGIFDVMMPKIDGFTLAEKIIQLDANVPFIFLTAKKMKEDKLKGLKLGADDYIVKPFEADELVLRLNNILKRSGQQAVTAPVSTKIPVGAYVFDTKRLELHFENSIQRITEKEAALLLFLINNSNQLLKREVVLKAVWGNTDFFSGRSMDVYISKMRKHLSGDQHIAIESIRNIGLEFKLDRGM